MAEAFSDIQTEEPHDLEDTPYGRSLGIKSACSLPRHLEKLTGTRAKANTTRFHIVKLTPIKKNPRGNERAARSVQIRIRKSIEPATSDALSFLTRMTIGPQNERFWRIDPVRSKTAVQL